MMTSTVSISIIYQRPKCQVASFRNVELASEAADTVGTVTFGRSIDHWEAKASDDRAVLWALSFYQSSLFFIDQLTS